jgi:hypothetical protein
VKTGMQTTKKKSFSFGGSVFLMAMVCGMEGDTIFLDATTDKV